MTVPSTDATGGGLPKSGFARVAPNPLQPANARHRQSRMWRRSKDKP
jgi:hypothetical protein